MPRKLQCRVSAIMVIIISLIIPLPSSVSIAEWRDSIVDGVVVTKETGLVWQRGEVETMAWEQAINYCEHLKLGGYSKWRLPNVKELRSIINDGAHKPAVNTDKYPGVHSSDYWTNTTYVSSTYSYCINFTNGVVGYCKKNQKKHVRCIKSL